MALFNVALCLAVLAFVIAAVLAHRLRKSHPTTHASIDPGSTEWHPFWLFRLLSSARWRQLSQGLKLGALVAMTSLAASIAILLFMALRFAATGGGL